MAATPYQCGILKTLAVQRKQDGESYVAGGVALNQLLSAPRQSRDWIDVLTCDQGLQPLGYLAWAACGKDPGYNPVSLLAEISRAHYSQAELDALDFAGSRPDAVLLGSRWHEVLRNARAVCRQLPAEELGKCVTTRDHELFRGSAAELAEAAANRRIAFHEGRLGGSWPVFRD